MEKKTYQNPVAEVYLMEKNDIITTSGDNDASWDPTWTKIY